MAPETISQALYAQGRGELRSEPATALRIGRTRRKTHRQHDTQQQTRPHGQISLRPAEAQNRKVPGHGKAI